MNYLNNRCINQNNIPICQRTNSGFKTFTGAKFVRFAEVCKYLSHRVTELSHTIQARAVARACIVLILLCIKPQKTRASVVTEAPAIPNP